MQNAYTGAMKRITMRDFVWLTRPKSWKKDYKSLEATMEPSKNDDFGALILAVSDEDFHLHADLGIAPLGASSGLCIYHTDKTFTKLGANEDGVTFASSIGGYSTSSRFVSNLEATTLTWHLKRSGSCVMLGYSKGKDAQPEWISTLHLPAMEKAISFGFYFTNQGDCTYTGHLDNLRYTKTS